MKSRPYAISFVVLSSLSSASYALGPVTIIPSLAYQNKELSFEQNYTGAQSNKADFSASIPIINFSLTGVFKKFFLTLKIEKNLDETPTKTEETDRSEIGQFNLIAMEGSFVNVARQDVSLTFGYNVWKNLNVFGGYLRGKTTLTPNAFCADIQYTLTAEQISAANASGNGLSVNCSRINRAAVQFFLEDAGFSEDQPEYKQRYREKGPYLGVSYGFNIADIGTLSFSFAYANMDGEYRDNASDPENSFSGSFVAFHYEGSTTGTSLGATWTAPLGEGSAYFIDLRRQAYSMDGDDKTGLSNFNGVSLHSEEEMIGLTAGVQFYF